MVSVRDELVGRDVELTAALSAWARRRAGVVVTGPVGIGRSAFAAALAEGLAERGADVLVVRATRAAAQLPLAPLAPLLLEERPDGRPLVDAVAAELHRRATAGPLAVVVDDGQLLDAGSTAALADLLDAGVGFVAVTASAAEPDDRLLAHPKLTPLTLGPLDLTAVGAIVRARGSDLVDVEWWYERSGGNPRALVRLLALEGQDAGVDADDDDLHRLLVGFDADSRHALEVLAVAEPLPVSIFIGLLDPAAPSPAMVLVEVVAGDRDLVRYRHAADATAVVRSMRPLRLRAAVRAAVELLGPSADDGSPEALVQLVDLALRVNQPVAPARLAKAAATARLGRDGGLALRLARAAAQATGALGDVRRWADLAYEHGDDAGLAAAVQRLRQAAATGDDEAAVAAGLAEAEQAFWRDADTNRALAALDRALVGRHDDEVRAVRGRVLAASVRVADAMATAGPLARSHDPRVRAQAAVALGHAHRRRGTPSTAVETMDDVLAAPDADDTVLLVSRQVLAAGRALALAEAGRWSDATSEAVAARARSERSDDRSARAISSLVLAVVEAERGHAGPAAARAGRALVQLDELRQPAGGRWALAVLGLAGALAGDAVTATEAVSELARRPPHPATLFSLVESRAVALAAAFSRPGLARDNLAAAARALFAAGDVGAGVVTVHELAVAGAAGDALRILADVDGIDVARTDPGPALRISHVEALARRDMTGLDALADEFAERGGDRWAVECVTAGATLAAERGDARRARRRFGDALALLGRCPGMAPPAALADHLAGGSSGPLTSRELDVAVLAARGLTSREIATQLGLSVRTVDNHLSSCFDKLHVRSRVEIGPVLRRSGAVLR